MRHVSYSHGIGEGLWIAIRTLELANLDTEANARTLAFIEDFLYRKLLRMSMSLSITGFSFT